MRFVALCCICIFCYAVLCLLIVSDVCSPRRPVNANPLKVWVGKLPENYDATKLGALFAGVEKIDQHDTYAPTLRPLMHSSIILITF